MVSSPMVIKVNRRQSKKIEPVPPVPIHIQTNGTICKERLQSSRNAPRFNPGMMWVISSLHLQLTHVLPINS